MRTFTTEALRKRSTELVRSAEAGKLSLVTKGGKPVFVAVPFTGDLLHHGVPMALALRLFVEQQISATQAARLAGISLSEFIDLLGTLGIPVTRLDEGELEREIASLE